jgi:hypothetical protein
MVIVGKIILRRKCNQELSDSLCLKVMMFQTFSFRNFYVHLAVP